MCQRHGSRGMCATLFHGHGRGGRHWHGMELDLSHVCGWTCGIIWVLRHMCRLKVH